MEIFKDYSCDLPGQLFILQSWRVSESLPPSSEFCPLLQEAAHGEHSCRDHWWKAAECFNSSAYLTKGCTDVCDFFAAGALMVVER